MKPYQNIMLVVFGLLMSSIGLAQAPIDAAVAAPSKDNGLLYLMVAIAAVLLVAIVFLGNVLVSLTRMAYNKRKMFAMIALLFAANLLNAQDGTPTSSSQPSSSFLTQLANTEVVFGIVVIVTELTVLMWMLLRIRGLLAEISDEKKRVKRLRFHLPHIFDNINASVAVAKEKDILLDHNYDGIRELDNSLPPWWKYSFYLSIIWAIFYLGYYYFGGGPSSLQEYEAEVVQAKIEVETYNKKNALNVDENNVKLAEAAGIIDGQEIYKTNCAACHGGGGEGLVGPNLTDNYWIHGGSLNEIFKSVKYGWPAKGMKSWQTDLSAIQIKNVVGYIHSIQGTNPPNAKGPQGELFTAGKSNMIDSTMIALPDSVMKKT